MTEFEINWEKDLDTMDIVELRSTILLMYDWVKMHQASVNKAYKQKQQLKDIIKSMEKVLDNSAYTK